MLRVENLSKRYPLPPRWARPLVRVASRKPVDVVRDVSFQVDVGEVVGLVGPNGAGKSTLIRVIAGLLEPSSGEVFIDGDEVSGSQSARNGKLGLMLEGERGLYSRLNGAQNLEFFGVMSGLRRSDAVTRAALLMDQMDLADRDKLVFGYSSGMRLRLSIARALLANPPLVVLDEPTRSLDPVASLEIGSLLRRLATEGHAVLVSNHRLDEVIAVCDRVLAIVDGQLRFDGPPSDLAGPGAHAQQALVELLAREAE
jgi:ABC-2 type transport system ATP-binding protein